MYASLNFLWCFKTEEQLLFLLLLFPFSLFKIACIVKQQIVHLLVRKMSSGSIRPEKIPSFVCDFFFYVAVVWLCINVHSFNETYLQL